MAETILKKNIMTGKTKSGFAFRIDPQKLNNWRTMRRLAAMSKAGDAEQLPALFDMADLLLGDEQISALEKHVEKLEGVPEGCASFSGVMSEFTEILWFAQNDEALKNSFASPD